MRLLPPAVIRRVRLADAPILVLGVPAATPAHAAGVPKPSEFLGFAVGADRTLADYRQIAAYLAF